MATNVSQEQSDILLAFQGKNKRVGVWFMRQAGRYLPQYQSLKRQPSFTGYFFAIRKLPGPSPCSLWKFWGSMPRFYSPIF